MTLRDEFAQVVRSTRAWGVVRLVGAAGGGSLAVFALVAWLVSDARWLEWPRALPFIGWGAAVAVLAVSAWWGRQMVRGAFSPVVVASVVEREGRVRHGALRGALEVADQSPLGAAAAAHVRASLGAASAWAPMWRTRVRRAAVGGVAGLLAALVMAATVARTSPDGWAATVHPLRAATGTLLATPRVEGPALAVRGTPLAVRLNAPGRKRLRVRWRLVGSAWRDSLVTLTNGAAPLALGRADADVAVVADDGRATSDTAAIRVVERPYIGDVTVRAVYPRYLDRESEDLAPGDAMRVPRGTTLQLSALASVPLAWAALVHERDTVRLVATPDGTRLTGALTADRSRAWTWAAATQSGQPAPELPRSLLLDVLPDSAPEISIVSPARDTTTSLGLRVPVTIAAQDDHGLGRVRLLAWRVRAEGGESAVAADALADRPGLTWAGTLMVDVAARGLEPGDALRLVAEAVDASPWSQTTRSRPVLLRIPSLDEQRQLARDAADTAASLAQRVAAAQRALEKRTADEARARAAQAAKGDKTMSFEQAEQARQLSAEQRRTAERAKDVAKEAAALERRLQQAGGLDSALAQRLREVQAMLNEAMTPEMAERLKQLEAAAQQLSAGDAAEQMQQLRQDQQKLREQLERSAALLQRAALEGAMQTLKDEAAELAAREQALADSMAASAKSNDAAKRSAPDTARASQAKRMAERTERFAKEAEKLQQRLQQAKAQPGAQGAQEAKAQAKEAAAEMQQAAGQAGQQPKAAADDARNAAQAMQRAAQALNQGRQAQIADWKREIAQELDRASQELQQLAQQQQQLAQQAQAGGEPGGMQGDQAAVQQGVERAADRMGATGKSSSLVSQRAQRAMAEAKRQVQEAAKQNAEAQGTSKQRADAMRQAAQQLQQAAQALARDRERVNRSESASGFSELLEELQRAAQRQSAASQSAQQLLQLNPQQRAQRADALRALAEQQRQVARALDAAGADDATGRTDAMAQEAKRLAERLEQGGPDRETLARQQQLFRRLLDAGKSLEQRDTDEQGKREAKSGGAQSAAPVRGAVAGAAALAPAGPELRTLTSDERRLVGDYFRRLNAVPRR